MKNTLIFLMTISFCLTISAQNLDLILTTTGDSIYCKIDSVSGNDIYFQTIYKDKWVRTKYAIKSAQAIKYDFVNEEASNDNLNRQSVSGEAKIRYKTLKSKYSNVNYKYQKTDRYSPGIAGLFAAVPGAGHFYTGEPMRGIGFLGYMGTSLVVSGVGLFYAFSTDSVLAPIAFLGGATGFVVSYFWSIFDAIKVSKVKNLAIRDNVISFQILPALDLNTNGIYSNNFGLSAKIFF